MPTPSITAGNVGLKVSAALDRNSAASTLLRDQTITGNKNTTAAQNPADQALAAQNVKNLGAYSAALGNTQQFSAYVVVASGGLKTIDASLTRLNEMAVSGANETMTASGRVALQMEANTICRIDGTLDTAIKSAAWGDGALIFDGGKLSPLVPTHPTTAITTSLKNLVPPDSTIFAAALIKPTNCAGQFGGVVKNVLVLNNIANAGTFDVELGIGSEIYKGEALAGTVAANWVLKSSNGSSVTLITGSVVLTDSSIAQIALEKAFGLNSGGTPAEFIAGSTIAVPSNTTITPNQKIVTGRYSIGVFEGPTGTFNLSISDGRTGDIQPLTAATSYKAFGGALDITFTTVPTAVVPTYMFEARNYSSKQIQASSTTDVIIGCDINKLSTIFMGVADVNGITNLDFTTFEGCLNAQEIVRKASEKISVTLTGLGTAQGQSDSAQMTLQDLLVSTKSANEVYTASDTPDVIVGLVENSMQSSAATSSLNSGLVMQRQLSNQLSQSNQMIAQQA